MLNCGKNNGKVCLLRKEKKIVNQECAKLKMTHAGDESDATHIKNKGET